MTTRSKLITRNELTALLLATTAQTIVSMVCITEPKMRATGNPFRIGRGENAVLTIAKANKVNGTINPKYQQIVLNKHKREIEAERLANGLPTLSAAELDKAAEARPSFGTSWHTPVLNAEGQPTCISRKAKNDTGERYIRFVVKAAGAAEYLRYADGSNVPTEEIAPYLAPKSEYGNQNLGDDAVIFVVYDLANIVEIANGGERYRISDNFTDRPMEMRSRVWDMAEEYLEGERKMQAV